MAGSELDLRLESFSMTILPAGNCWALSHVQNYPAPMVLCHNPICSHFIFVIIEWWCAHFGVIKMDCNHRCVPRATYLTHTLAFGLEFQRAQMWQMCEVLCVFLHPQVSTVLYMLKVWAAEWSEGLWCQKLTSCGFSCPSCKRYWSFTP